MTLRERVLDRPGGYSAWKRVIKAAHHMDVFVGDYLKPLPGERVLDLGCGTGDAVAHLPDVDYVGIDLNADYIATAQKRDAPRARFIAASVEELAGLDLPKFDAVICVGVLHHLPDDVVTEMLGDLGPVLAPGARFAAIDPVWSPDSGAVARVLAALDRGKYVRDAGGYARLVGSAFADVHTSVRHDLLAMPYSHCITCGNRATSG